ncbi:MAG TPA: hypothetical protein VH619_02520 [Verrucomicrobiae bacterium]|nr:hypothetical protein [Verrucomicrobiae bacterium]
MKKRPVSPGMPRVLLHKPAEKPPIDESISARDWSTHPSGSYLSWLSENADKKPAK